MDNKSNYKYLLSDLTALKGVGIKTTNSIWPIKETYSKYKTPINPHQKEPKEVNSKPLLN